MDGFLKEDFNLAVAALGTEAHLKDGLSQALLARNFSLTTEIVRETAEDLRKIINLELGLERFEETEFVLPRDHFIREQLLFDEELFSPPIRLFDQHDQSSELGRPPYDRLKSFGPEIRAIDRLEVHFATRLGDLAHKEGSEAVSDEGWRYIDSVIDEIWKRAVSVIEGTMTDQGVKFVPYETKQLTARGEVVKSAPRVIFKIQEPIDLSEMMRGLGSFNFE